MLNGIPLVLHNGSNYDYHFIIKELANEFEEKSECLGENKNAFQALSFRSCKISFSSWISIASSFKKD